MQRDMDQNKYKNLKVIGPWGDFKTLDEAVTWFNASATDHTTLRLDAGSCPISATITINNPTYDLQIIGSEATQVEAATGLLNTPMFVLDSDCDFRQINVDGSTLATYGTHANENFVTFNTAGIYSEIVDTTVNGFRTAVSDGVGADLFMFNFVVSDCNTGIITNYTGGASATSKDIEVGNFENCGTSINLNSATSENFMLAHLIFYNTSGQTAILYNGTTYTRSDVSNIFNCTYNNIGTFLSGFDFSRTDGRDANIEVIGNIGSEDKFPHGKINIVDSTATTLLTTANTFYKANFNSKKRINFNVAATSGNFTISVGAQTTGNIAWNANAATIQTALNLLSNVTSCTVVQITASKTWTVEFTTAGKGWIGMQPVVNMGTLSPTTSADITPDTYSCKLDITNNRMTYLTNRKRDVVIWISGSVSVDAGVRIVELGVVKNSTGAPLGNISLRISASGQPYPFSSVVYTEDMGLNDYVEIWASSQNSGDIITLSDVSWFLKAL